MKRLFDIIVASLLLAVAAPLLALVALAVKATSRGPVLFPTQRVGKANGHFTMFKFRTMRTNTPQVATHLLRDPHLYLTPIGGLLRRSSLDELPQLINVLRGDMSLVGPRPALFNQADLVALRTQRGIHRLSPGITGWAQVNGRDELPLEAKVAMDAEYLEKRSWLMDGKIIWRTAWKALGGADVSH